MCQSVPVYIYIIYPVLPVYAFFGAFLLVKLQKLVNICSRITGQQQPSLANVYDRQVLKKAKQILKDDTHFLFSEYDLLPLKKHFRIPVCKTNTIGGDILLFRHLLVLAF